MLYKGLTFFHRGLLKVRVGRCFCLGISVSNLSPRFKSWLLTRCFMREVASFPRPAETRIENVSALIVVFPSSAALK